MIAQAHRLVGAATSFSSCRGDAVRGRRRPLRPAGICRSTRSPTSRIRRSSSTRDYPGQAPQVVEDQVTYPLTTAMLTVPKSKVVRGFSFFGVSFVYVIFEDGTDIYWARSRVLEYLEHRRLSGYRQRRHADPRSGRHGCGLGLPIRHYQRSN